MEDLYKKNLDALQVVNPLLYIQLEKIQTNTKFEVFIGKEQKNIDLLDIEQECWVHNTDKGNIKLVMEDLSFYREYPFLYFFGLGNGLVINELLKNEKHKQIIVIEPDIEMIYIALNFMDVREDILSKRFAIVLKDDWSYSKAIEAFHSGNAKFYTKLFKLHVVSDYYQEERLEEYKSVFDISLRAVEQLVKAAGNDVTDSLLGLKHHIRNLSLMVSLPKYSDLLTSKNSDLAVVVSTGPSLYKQLPLLKEAAEHITIISVDASFPILVKHGIKPDIVVSMERDEPTSKFFVETSKEEQEGVVFLCASLQHTSVFDAIKAGQLVLTMRPFAYNTYFKLDDYGYICAGMSAANMAHELAAYMRFKTCAFIGQDLAYGDDGKSHSEGHVFGADQIKDGVDTADKNACYETIKLPAYGHKGTVDSMMFWELFLRFIEQTIEQTEGQMVTINATEGGAHIRGSVEIPFKKVLEKHAIQQTKEPIMLPELEVDETEQNTQLIKQKIKTILTEGRALQERINKSFLIIAEECKVLENIAKEEALKAFDIGKTISLLEEISAVRREIEVSDIYTNFISNIAQAILLHEELKLAEIKVRYVDNPDDNQLKALQWILEHRYWLFSLSGIIENVLHIVQEESQPYMG